MSSMTPQEFADKMQALSKGRDVEMVHYNMDELLCEVLTSLGYMAGVEIFNNQDKWYA